MNSIFEQTCRRLKRLSVVTALLSAGLAANAQDFTNLTAGNAINIPEVGKATPYPTTVTLGSDLFDVDLVRVILKNFSHEDPDDVDILLVHERDLDNKPETRERRRGVILMSDVGGQINVDKIDLTLWQGAANELPDQGPLTSGTFKPTNKPRASAGETNDDEAADVNAAFGLSGNDTIHELAANLNEITSFDDGTGKGGRGRWQLYVLDDREVGSGAIASGFEVQLQGRPKVDGIANQTIDEDKDKTVDVKVSDNAGADNVTVFVSIVSQTGDILNDAALTLSGSGGTRQLKIDPRSDRNGQATVRVRVVDGPVNNDKNPVGNTLQSDTTFTVTVNPINDAPTITSPGDQVTTIAKAVGPFEIEIDDGGVVDNETPVATLFNSLSVTSSNTGLIPAENVFFLSRDGKKIRVLVAPEGKQSGNATITIKVTDNAADGGGGDNKSAEAKFNVNVGNVPQRTFARPQPISTDGDSSLTFSGGLNDLLGVSANAAKLEVVLSGVNIANPENVLIELVSPTGDRVTLMDNVGGANPVVNGRITFNDSADKDDPNSNKPEDRLPNTLPDDGAIPANAFVVPTIGNGSGAQPRLADLGPTPINGDWAISVTGLQPGDQIRDGYTILANEGPIFTSISDEDGQLGNGIDVVVDEDMTVAVPFIIADNDTNVNDLEVSATSSNVNAVANDRLTFNTQDGSNRTLLVRPNNNFFHTPGNFTEITINVKDGFGDANGAITFKLVVNPVNDAPQISFIDRQVTRDGDEILNIPFTITDVDTPLQTLTISTSSSNDKIVPDDPAHLVLSQTTGVHDTDVFLSIFPVPQGNLTDNSTLIELTVTDNGLNGDGVGALSSTISFETTVRPAESILTVNQSEVALRDNNTAQPFPSTINRTGIAGLVKKVTVTLAGLNHNDPEDIQALLVGPSGAGVILMSGAGGSTDVGAREGSNTGNDNGIQITFDQDAATQIPDSDALTSGRFQPGNFNNIATVAGGPAGPFNGANLSTFENSNPNGNWNLYLRDANGDGNDHFGLLAEGWSINIITKPVVNDLPNSITILEDTEQTIKVTVGDNQGASEEFTVTAVSSNPGLIPQGNISISPGSSSGERILKFKGATNANSGSGNNPETATITVTVTDPMGNTATDQIVVTITPVNDDPTIAFVAPDKDLNEVTVGAGMATKEFRFDINDAETPAQDLEIIATASDPTLVSEIVIGDAGDADPRTQTVQVIPSSTSAGRVTINLLVRPKNGTGSANVNFTVIFDSTIVSAFSNKGGITIIDNSVSSPNPSNLGVSGLVGPLSNVKVVIDGFTHGFPDDVDIVLESPQGTRVTLLSDVGGNTPVSDLRFEIEDSAPANFGNTLQSGRFRPTNEDGTSTDSIFGGTNLGALNGQNPNGIWKLNVRDDFADQGGSIDSWSLLLNTGPAISISNLESTNIVRDDKNDADAANDTFFDLTGSLEDTAAIVNFTVGDSDTGPNNLKITAEAFEIADYRAFVQDGTPLPNPSVAMGTFLVPRTFLKNGDGNFIDKDGKVIGAGELETKGIRTDLVLSGTDPTKRSLRIVPAPNKNLDGNALKGGNGANKDDQIDPLNDGDSFTVIQVTVDDGFSPPVRRDFVYRVNRVNDAPRIVDILGDGDNNRIGVNEDGSVNVDVIIADLEDSPTLPGARGQRLKLGVVSGNTSIIRDTGDNKDWAIIDDGDNNPGTQRIRFTPRPNTNGDVLLTFTVTDDDPTQPLSGNKQLTLRVNSVNDAPRIGQLDNNGNIQNGLISDQTIRIGDNKTIVFNVTDLETSDALLGLEFESSNPQIFPSSAFEVTKVDGGSREVKLTPAGLLTGNDVQVTFRVKDSDGGVSTAVFEVDVVESIGQTLSNPTAITIFDAANNGPSAASPYPSTINGNNFVGGGAVRNVIVTLNNIRHLNPDDIDILLVHGGKTVALMSDAGGTADLPLTRLRFEDSASNGLPDEGPLGFGAFRPTNFEGSEKLPGTAPAVPNGGYSTSLSEFNGTNAAGPWELYVSDDTDNDLAGLIQDGWSLSVIRAPVIAGIPDQTINEDEVITLNLNAASQSGQLDKLKFSATSNKQSLVGNNGLKVNNGAQTLEITPARNAFSVNNDDFATITVTVTDDVTGQSQSTTFNVRVNAANDRPTIIGLPRNPIILSEEEKTDVAFSVNDIEDDNGTLKVRAISSNNALIEPNNDSDISGVGSNRSISIKPKPNQTGNATITVEVTDSGNLVGVALFDVQVRVVNDPPTISVASATASTGSGDPVGIKVTVDDPDTALGDLVLSASSNNTNLVPNTDAALTFSAITPKDGKGESTLTITPVAERDGNATITISVKDNGGSTVSTTVALTVRPSTNRIFANDDNGDGTTGDGITINASGTATPYPSSVNVAGLRGPLARIAVRLRGVNHTFPGDIDARLDGPNGNSVVLTSDNGANGDVVAATLTFDDAAANGLIGNNNIGSGTFKPTDNDTQAGDQDNFPAPALDPSTEQGSLTDAFVGINGNGQWRLFIVDDAGGDGGSVTGGWELIFQTAPTIGSIADVQMAEDSTLKVNVSIGDQDTPLGLLTVAATSDNDDLISDSSLAPVNSEGNVLLTLSPRPNQTGSADITVTVTDQDGHKAQTTFNVSVQEANDAPRFTSEPGDVQLASGTTSSVSFGISDSETASGALSVSATSDNSDLLPNGSIGVANNNGAVTLTLNPVGTGSAIVTVVVTDGDGVSVNSSFSVAVIPALTSTFMNNAVTTINDNQIASPYPSVINISGRSGQVTKLTVELVDLTHTFVADVDVLLVGPSGDSVLLMSDAGGTSGVDNIDLVFDSTSSNSLPGTSAISSGTYRPTNITAGQSQQDNVFPAPAPQNPLAFGSDLGVFAGSEANGAWRLFIRDDAGGDVGSLGAWKLNITTLAPLITGLVDTTINEDETAVVNFAINGEATNVTVSSSNQTLVPNKNISIGDGVLTISPEPKANGQTVITVTVLDGPKGEPTTNEITDSFVLTVLDVNNAAPSISSIPDQSVFVSDLPLVVPFAVTDPDTAIDEIVISQTPNLGPFFALSGPEMAAVGTTQLSGANENPAVDTAATGSGNFILTDSEISITVNYSGLSSPLTAAHIHGLASPSDNAGVLINLRPETGATSGTISGTFAVDETTRQAIMDGLTYVNIHTVNHGPGEIRGQLQVVDSQNSYKYELSIGVVGAAEGVLPINILALDTNGTTTSSGFEVTFVDNEAPVVFGLSSNVVESGVGESAEVSFAIADADNAVEDLTVTVSSDNQSVVKDSDLSLSTVTAGTRVLSVTPSGAGVANLTISVSDGVATGQATIQVRVAGKVVVSLNDDGAGITLSWEGGLLQSAPTPLGPWTLATPIPVQGPAEIEIPLQGDQLYFRTVQ